MTEQEQELIQRWNHANEQLAYWKEQESELRDKISLGLFDNGKDKGTFNVDIAHGSFLSAR